MKSTFKLLSALLLLPLVVLQAENDGDIALGRSERDESGLSDADGAVRPSPGWGSS